MEGKKKKKKKKKKALTKLGIVRSSWTGVIFQALPVTFEFASPLLHHAVRKGHPLQIWPPCPSRLLGCFALETKVADNRTTPDFVIFFSIFKVYIVSSYVKLSETEKQEMVIALNFRYIHQLSRSAHVLNYNCIGHRLLPYCKLIENLSCTVDLWICMFDDACHSLDRNVLCHSIKISISLERLNRSFPFFHHCKGKSMTYLEMDNFSCS